MMKLSCSITLPENEYMRLLHIAHAEMARDPKGITSKGIVLTLGQNKDYIVKLPRKQMWRDIQHLKHQTSQDSYWNLPQEKLALLHKAP